MDDFHRNKLVMEHLELVKIIALKMSAVLPSSIELDDLIHTGILGLIDAAKRYNPEKNTKFSTYASLRIRGAIIDELRNLDWASRNLRQRIKEIEQAFNKLEIELGRPPAEEEVAASLNITLPEFHKLLDKSRGIGIGVFRYGQKHEENISSENQLKFYIDDNSSSPVQFFEKKEMKKLVAGFIDELPEKEKLILSLYYLDELNLKEIGKVLNLTESRISQIRTTAIIRLRSKIVEIANKDKVSQSEVL